MNDLKVALVTGAASGMGRISSKRLAADGVHVAAVDVNEEGLNELKQESNNISIFPCDLSDSNAVKTMVQKVQSEVGSIDRVTQAGAVMPMARIQDLDSMILLRCQTKHNEIQRYSELRLDTSM